MWGVRWLCCRAPPGHDQIEEFHLFNYFWIAEMSISNIFAKCTTNDFWVSVDPFGVVQHIGDPFWRTGARGRGLFWGGGEHFG